MAETAKLPQPAHRRRARISLRVSVVAISLLTVAFTAAAVHLPWLWISRENVAEMSDQLNTEIVAGVNREVAAIFDSAIAAQTTLRDALHDGVIDIEDKKGRDRLFFAFLNANPHFSWVSFGKPNGDFYGAQRRDDVNLRIAESKWDAANEQAVRHEDYFVNDGERISHTISRTKINDYFAPDRSWYRKAVRNPEQHIWTDVYVFDTSRKPGLNSAITFGRDGGLVGVISIAIELDRISRYLKMLTSMRSGTVFIIDRRGRLIAFPDASEVTRSGTVAEMPELKALADSYHPLLQVAESAIETGRIDLATLAGTAQVRHETSADRYFITLQPAAGRADWIIGTVIPESDFMARIEANYGRLGLAVLAAILFVGLFSIFAARSLIIAPLQRIMGQTTKIREFDLQAVEPVISPIVEIDALSQSMESMSRGLDSFRRYLPGDLVRTLMAQGMLAQPGGERRTLSIMFIDLEGFTSASERLGHRIVPLLTDYLTGISRAMVLHRATIDKFIGDSVMAFWGAPHHNEEHATDACRAALECVERFAEIQDDWVKHGLPAMNVRIGLNSGRVVVGNIGSDERLNYTVIGDPVNLASRLEGMNKKFGTSVLITQNTFELAKYDIVARRLDAVTVRGRAEPVAVYELLAMRDEKGVANGFEWVAIFEKGMTLFADHRWHEAAQQFRTVIEMRGGDPPSRVFLARCEEAIEAEPKHPVLATSRPALPPAATPAE